MKKLVAAAQGIYYITAGLWPLLSMQTFESATGPKTDDWLVVMISVLVIVIGLALLGAAIKLQIGMPVLLLGIGTAGGLSTIEFFYAMRGMIWPVYLLDAIGELILIVFWGVALYRDRRPPLTTGSKSLAG